MKVSLKLVLTLLIPFVSGLYKIVTENLTLEYVDRKYIDLTAGTYKLDHTIALNTTFKMKFDLPENYKLSVKGYRWLVNDYKLQMVDFEKNFKDLIEMETFDLQSLWVYHARPPVVWPIQKGVTYRINGWIPDSSKFPNLPEGKWKIQSTEHFPNKTRVAVINWFARIDYN